MKAKLLICIGVPLVTIALLIYKWAFSLEERARFDSPDARYEAVIERYRYNNITFRPGPGSGSDYRCFLSIYEKESGEHMGTAPVFIAAWAYDLVWTEDGAYIQARPGPEWNFVDKTCTYIDERGNEVSGL